MEYFSTKFPRLQSEVHRLNFKSTRVNSEFPMLNPEFPKLNSEFHRLNSEELVAFNPSLAEYSSTTRRAYAKFKSAILKVSSYQVVLCDV